MSVPIFEVTKSQILDWCQTGRLAGGSDARAGQWLVMEYGCEYARPLRYVKVFCACDTYEDAINTLDFFAARPVSKLGWEHEVWHVASVVGNDCAGDYVSDHDDERILVQHWDPIYGIHVSVLMDASGVWVPRDFVNIHPTRIVDCLDICNWHNFDSDGYFSPSEYKAVVAAVDRDLAVC